jgi:L-aminopeptidase/D-esterase-like protein
MRWLEEQEVGFATQAGPVPIVPGAVIYDLGLGSSKVRPGPEDGYRAAGAARGGNVVEGTVGAGTGATVAKIAGPEGTLKGGVGTASVAVGELVVGAIVVVNAIGAVVDPATGEVVAGARGKPGKFLGLEAALKARDAFIDSKMENTTLVVVATNATLAHGQVQRLAYQAHNGIARAILPAHTFGDGDTTIAISMGQAEAKPQDIFTLGLMTTMATERAIVKGVRAATGLHGVPSVGEWLAAP